MMKTLALTLSLILSTSVFAQCGPGGCGGGGCSGGSCGGGSCGPGGCGGMSFDMPRYQSEYRPTVADGWYQGTNAKNGELFYWKSGRVHGCYSPLTGTYVRWVFENQSWEVTASDPPSSPPLARSVTSGVVSQNIQSYARYSISGHAVNKGDVIEAMASGLTDDRSKIRITITDDDAAKRKQVRNDLASASDLAPFKDRSLVQDYPRDHWAVKGVGHYTEGKPTVCVQAAPNDEGKGVVLHQQVDYDGPASLATALRRADPNYHPESAPDLRFASPTLPGGDMLIWLVAGAVVLFMLKGDK